MEDFHDTSIPQSATVTLDVPQPFRQDGSEVPISDRVKSLAARLVTVLAIMEDGAINGGFTVTREADGTWHQSDIGDGSYHPSATWKAPTLEALIEAIDTHPEGNA